MTLLDDKRARADDPQNPRPRRQQTNFSDTTPSALVANGFSRAAQHAASNLMGTDQHAPNSSLGAEQDVPPAYSEHHDQFSLHQTGFDAGAAVTDDGRVNINLNQTSRQLADIIAPAFNRQLKEEQRLAAEEPLPPAYIPPSLGGQPGQRPPPKLNVVIQIVGSRGDVQPFVALGQVLRNTYGHRVRIATHSTFQKFVEENGLEFFNIGGDPAELMAFMVKHPGLMPGFDAVKSGEVTKRRKGIEQILLGCWRSCIEPGTGFGPAPQFSRLQDAKNEDPMDLIEDHRDASNKPFVADAIIANPPSFAHIHVAEKLGIPLHLMFTMPWSPTRAFPQPLANIQSTNTDPVTTNYVSYALVEMMTWQGLGDVINRFRTKILDLEPLPLLWAPAVLTRLRIPYTYCWSPALIPKPKDWGQHIDIAGFYFLNLATNYTPDPELAAFLEAGPPPVYIGFGSIVVDDPNHLTRMIFDAVASTGVRALVSKGWGGLGADDVGLPDGVFMLGNCPHDWLFNHVSAVVHHGGAGTTAAGINAGKPTVVVPFFGDQPFWGAMVARAGAGPNPIPYKKLTTESLAEAIQFTQKPDTQERARDLGAKIREENGADEGAQSFHKHLLPDRLRCSIVPSRAAVWRVRRSQTHLSALAAASLVQNGHIQYSDLKLFRAKEYNTEDHPTDPISAVSSALMADLASIGLSVADFPRDIFKAARGPPKTKTQDSTDDKPDDKSSTTNVETASTQANATLSSTSVTSLPAAGASTTTLGSFESSRTRASTLRSPDDNAATADEAKSSPSEPHPLRSHPVANSPGPVDSSRSPLAQEPERGSSDSPNAARSPSPPTSPPQKSKSPPSSPPPDMTFDRAATAGKSINNIVTTGIKSPMNFCMGLARGFRNVPRLYNDDTVRPPEKVTNLASGLKIAGKEFGFGMYDGISGLVTQPYKGAVKEGGVGLIKGIGKGIGGIAFKPAAGFWGIPAYAMAGLDAEVRAMFAKSAQNYIIASRISQGNDDLKESTEEERNDIELRWVAHQPKMKGYYAMKARQKGKGRETSPEAIPATDSDAKSNWFEERRAKKRSETGSSSFISGPFFDEKTAAASKDDEFERAIRTAVQETSAGDAGEDARIEQAIRASVRALRSRSSTISSSTTTSSGSGNSAANAGYPVDWKQKGAAQPFAQSMKELDLHGLDDVTDEEYQSYIEQAVQASMAEQARQWQDGPYGEEDYDYQRALARSQTEVSKYQSDEDDEEYRRAVEESRRAEARAGQADDEAEFKRALEASQAEQHRDAGEATDEELRRAIEESERAHKEELAKQNSQRSEEDIVMEFVKKQSLAEEQYRLSKNKGKGKESAGSGENEDDDEDLKRALEESLRFGNGSGSGSRHGGPSGT